MQLEVISNKKVVLTRTLENNEETQTLLGNKRKAEKEIYIKEKSDIYSEEEEDESYSSDSYEDKELDEEDYDNSNSNSSQRKLLRKYGTIEDEKYLNFFSNNKEKKKKELTEEEIAKKVEQVRLRKLHAKKLLEEEKKEAVERILNEDGRKLRERQKKINEENKKKTLAKEEKLKISLTKIKHIYQKNGNVFVRFPQGLLLPSVLTQKKKIINEIPKCQRNGCNNFKKYKDPLTQKYYCSVSCFKIIRNQASTNI